MKFQNLVQALPDAVLVHSGGTIVFVNPATVKLLGASSPQQLLGRQLFDFVHPDFIPAIQERIRTIEGPDTPLEHLMLGVDGSHKDVEALAIPFTWEGAPAIEVVIRDVSERRRVEHSIQDWNKRLELAQKSGLNIGLWQWDMEKNSVEWSDETYRQFGLKRETFCGRVEDVIASIHPDDRANVQNAIERSVAASTDYASQYRTIWPDGSVHWIDARGSAVRNGSTKMIGIGIDITDLKRAEEASRRSEEQYRVLFDQNPQPMWVYEEPSLRFMAVNQAAIDHYGYTREEFLSMSLCEIRPEEDVPKLLDLASENRVPGRSQVGIWRHRTKDGRIIYVDITDREIELQGRRAFLVLANDVTDGLKAEEALKASEEKYREFVENASFGIYRCTPDGTLLDVNPALVSMLGYDSKRDLMRCNLNTSIYEKESERANILARHASEDRISGVVTTWKRKDGSVITVRLTGKEVRKADQISHYEVIAEDITERRLLEEQLRQSQKMEAVGRLAGGVAHDFNNALGVITGYSELLQFKLTHDETLHRQAGEIFRAGQKAASLTRQLLAFSRKQPMRPQVLNLNTVVADVERMLRRLIGENIDLVHVGASDLAMVEADPGQIEQVLMNLSVNARDAMPMGGKLRIETTNAVLDDAVANRYKYVKPGRYVMISVTDTGCGMDENTQSHIFEPFFTTKEVGKGTGLGLSTVYGIVKQSGGYIWVDSAPGEGSRFRIYLPTTSDTARSSSVEQKAVSIPLGSETILVVEDEPALRELACSSLQSGGYTVLEAGSGESALATAKQHDGRIHLLLTDVILPGISGKELAAILTDSYPGVKTIFMSGYTDDLLGPHGVLDHDVTLLEKPFSNKTLFMKIRAVLDA